MLNLSLILFPWKSSWEGASFVLEIQTGGGGGLALQEIQVRGGLKNDPNRRGGERGSVDFFTGITQCSVG